MSDNGEKMLQISVHSMAVKYGGKFVDSFLKGNIVKVFGCSSVVILMLGY